MEGKKDFHDCHKRLIELLSIIDKTCKEYGIKYSLHGGTLLGAERNGHMIPWDDDADISMQRSEFNKLKTINKEHGLPFKIERGKNAPWLTSFSNTSSDGIKTEVDVFLWDYIGESSIKQHVKINLLRFIQGMLKTEIDYSSYTIVQLVPVFISHIVGIPFTLEFKQRLYDKVSKGFLVGNKKCIHRSNDSFISVGYIFDSDYMKSFKSIKLEGKEFMVTERYKEFLIRSYGENYMIPLNEEDRKVSHGHKKELLSKAFKANLFLIKRK